MAPNRFGDRKHCALSIQPRRLSRWGFGWVDKAQYFQSARRIGAVGLSSDFCRAFPRRGASKPLSRKFLSSRKRLHIVFVTIYISFALSCLSLNFKLNVRWYPTWGMVASSAVTCLESMVIKGVLRVKLDFIVMDRAWFNARLLGNGQALCLVALVSLRKCKNFTTFDSVTLEGIDLHVDWLTFEAVKN